MATVLSLYIANLKEFTRNRASLFWTFAFPLLFIILFGLIYGNNSSSISYSLGIVDQDNSKVSQQAINLLKQASVLHVSTDKSLDAQKTDLKKGQLDMILVIPPGFQADIQAKQTTNLPLIYDQTKNTANGQVMQGVVEKTLSYFNQNIINVEGQNFQTQTINALDILIAGILAMSLMQLGLFATAMPLVALRQQGVLRRMGATPLPRWQVMVGQILLRLTIGFAQMAIILGISIAAFHLKIQGNILALAGLVLLGSSAFIGLGYMIASFVSNTDAANGLVSTIQFPMLFLSGIFFPLSFLPAFLKPVIYALPISYLADALRQVIVNSTPDFPMSVDIAVLAAWLVVTGLISVRFFKWE
jgi:ABC-2 type transport system permease protein